MRSRPSASLRSARHAAMGVFRGRLPSRYQEETSWVVDFETRIRAAFFPGMQILDAGSGRRPALAVHSRPADCRYVGLDLSRSELEHAPGGSYDEMFVGDLTKRVAELEGRFDLIICFQVLEHVKPLDEAIENLRCYLRPGGRLVTQLSGSFAVFGIVNRLIPSGAAVWMLRNFHGRAPETVFPAYYDRCWSTSLERMLAGWSKAEVIPMWQGAAYFRFSKPLLALYVAYEEWARSVGHRDLATHYVIDASR